MSKLKIVLAEDNVTFALLLKFVLEKEGYQILSAVDGQKAIVLIEEHKPDIVLTDLNMPFVNGLQVISHVRENLKLNTPIIFFSADSIGEMALEAKKLGANDSMEKPFNPMDLATKIQELLEN
ncbi:response regulator [Lutibacter holmesii]|uniref:Response regulator n=1 Tax=Lutibacter holmesii TaxID=1137985 RepID=A0ABW3WQ27_9FLAO